MIAFRMTHGSVNLATSDLKPWKTMVPIGVTDSSIDFILTNFIPCQSMVSIWVAYCCIYLVATNLKPRKAMISIWMTNRCPYLAHLLISYYSLHNAKLSRYINREEDNKGTFLIKSHRLILKMYRTSLIPTELISKVSLDYHQIIDTHLLDSHSGFTITFIH